MFKTFLIVFFLLVLSRASFPQNNSVYTSLSDDKCRVKVDSKFPGVMNGVCPGVGDYELNIFSDDERMSVSVVATAGKKFDLDFWGYFGNFSSLGPKAEWRMNGKTPIGLIVRYEVSDRGDGQKPTSYLMVSKISATESCVVGIVKPGRNQNIRARNLADSAINRACLKLKN